MTTLQLVLAIAAVLVVVHMVTGRWRRVRLDFNTRQHDTALRTIESQHELGMRGPKPFFFKDAKQEEQWNVLSDDPELPATPPTPPTPSPGDIELRHPYDQEEEE
jgi:hypothetical protein